MLQERGVEPDPALRIHQHLFPKVDAVVSHPAVAIEAIAFLASVTQFCTRVRAPALRQWPPRSVAEEAVRVRLSWVIVWAASHIMPTSGESGLRARVPK